MKFTQSKTNAVVPASSPFREALQRVTPGLINYGLAVMMLTFSAGYMYSISN
jgi:hypothetical protein